MTALVDCIKCGCTTVIDHHASPKAVAGSLCEIAKATREAGIRASLCYEVSDRDGQKIAYEGIRENISFIDWAEEQNDPMISGKFGLHASFTLSDLTSKSAPKLWRKERGFHVHVAEALRMKRIHLPNTAKDRRTLQGSRHNRRKLHLRALHIHRRNEEIIRRQIRLSSTTPNRTWAAVRFANIRAMKKKAFLSASAQTLYLRHDTVLQARERALQTFIG